MKKLLLVIPLIALAACGNVVSDTIEAVKEAGGDFDKGKPIGTSPATVESFTRLAALGPDNVIFKTGDSFSIVAEGPAESIDGLRYVIEGGRLAIGRKKDSWNLGKSEAATITVTAPSITGLALAGSGDITADKVSGDDVKLSLAGSGDMRVGEVTAKKLKGSLAGSGDFVLAGKADNATYSIAGSGSVDASKLVVTDAVVSIAGSGDVSIHATGNVEGKIAGSGDINVTGGAKCTSSTAGSGTVSCG